MPSDHVMSITILILSLVLFLFFVDVNSKPFPRSSRRREPSVSNGAKLEPNRKPTPQKNKSFDKRPRPRGQYYGCGKENTKVSKI